jgi:parallel beta-helix repeat protein
MKIIFVIIWMLVILFLAIPIFLYGSFGQPWLTMNGASEVSNGQISGILLRSQTWRGEVFVSGDVYVAPWAQIEIAPGTLVKIAATDDQEAGQAPAISPGLQLSGQDPTASRAYARSHVHINGRIQALGTVSEPVRFVSAATEPGYAAWQGISLRSNSVLQNTTIAHAQTGLITTGDVHLERVVVSQMLWDCLRIRRGQARVENSEFSQCWQRGIVVLDSANPILTDNTVERSQRGLEILENSAPLVSNNKFSNNVVAVFLGTTGAAVISEDNTLISPTGPATAGADYEGNMIYKNEWQPGSGEKIEGTIL